MDLMTRLLLDTKGFDSNITNAAKYVQDFKQQGDRGKKGMEEFSSSMGLSLAKFAGWAGAGLLAKEGFDRFMAAGQTTSDWLDQQVAGWKGMMDGFFEALNHGDVSGFLSNMANVRDAFIDVAKARDAMNDHNLVDANMIAPVLNFQRTHFQNMVKEGQRTGDLSKVLKGKEGLRSVDKGTLEMTGASAAQAKSTYLTAIDANFTNPLAHKGYKSELKVPMGNVEESFESWAKGTQKFVTKRGGDYTGDAKKYYDLMAAWKSKESNVNGQLANLKETSTQRVDDKLVLTTTNRKANYYTEQPKVEKELVAFKEATGKAIGKLLGVDYVDPEVAAKADEMSDVNRSELYKDYGAQFVYMNQYETAKGSTIRQQHAKAPGGGGGGGKSEIVYGEGSFGYYDKAIKDLNAQLNQSTDFTISKGISTEIARLKQVKEDVEKALRPSEFAGVESKFENDSQRLKTLSDKGAIGNSELLGGQRRLAQSALEAASVLTDAGEQGEKFCEALKAMILGIDEQIKEEEISKKSYIVGAFTPRDATFDYKMSALEQKVATRENLQGNISRLAGDNGIGSNVMEGLKTANGDYSELKIELGSQSEELLRMLDELQKQEISISASIKVDTIRKDIKNLNRDVQRGAISTFGATTGAISSIYGNIKATINSLSDDSINGFEKFMSVIDTIGGTVSGIMSVVEAISSFVGIIQVLTGAKSAMAVVDGVLTSTSLAATAATATGSATDAVASTVSIVAAKAESAAFTELAAAKFMAAHAYIPFAGFAIGAGFVIASTAMIAGAGAVGAFADGGIIGGHSYAGDNLLASVNSGEMILNSNQQKNLFRMADGAVNGAGGGSVGSVKFKIRGKDLEGVLENLKRMKR